jgi:hypothetical protein
MLQEEEKEHAESLSHKCQSIVTEVTSVQETVLTTWVQE